MAAKLWKGEAVKQRRLFIGWVPQSRRSQMLAEKVDAELHMLNRLKHRSPWHAPLKYPWLALDTWQLLSRARPEVVFVQNPPPLLPLVVRLFSLKHPLALVIDHHTAAFGRAWFWISPIQKSLVRWAKLNIVTNRHWRTLIERWGGDVMILDDVPTQFPAGRPYAVNGLANVAVISTFAPDEPLETVVTAAARLPDVHFYVTGDSRRASQSLLDKAPENVTFTGFLPDDDYFGLLRSADAVMALTTRDHTNQRGACEAVWLGKPLITSDWPVLKSLFNLGTVHVSNTIEGIEAGVLRALKDRPKLSQEMLHLQDARREAWQTVSRKLEVILGGHV
jgi:glycosyltransferase involved in cell wall biosynthesis